MRLYFECSCYPCRCEQYEQAADTKFLKPYKKYCLSASIFWLKTLDYKNYFIELVPKKYHKKNKSIVLCFTVNNKF